jgi:hypothetical protein
VVVLGEWWFSTINKLDIMVLGAVGRELVSFLLYKDINHAMVFTGDMFLKLLKYIF